jgi:protein-tyrosine phosphatase
MTIDQNAATRFGTLIRNLLTSPPAMRLKRAMRNTVWALRGRRLVNPSLTDRQTSILFVCYGNICRSPFAERLAARLLEQNPGNRLQLTSAGLRASQAAFPPKFACAAARRYDVVLDDHLPLLLTSELMDAHDVIVVMEPVHRAEVLRRWPNRHSSVQLLPLFIPEGEAVGAFERVHLVDPFGKSLDEYERCYARIAAALPPLLRAIGARIDTGDSR